MTDDERWEKVITMFPNWTDSLKDGGVIDNILRGVYDPKARRGVKSPKRSGCKALKVKVRRRNASVARRVRDLVSTMAED